VSTTVSKHRNLIGGEWVDASSGETLEVLNPSTGEVIAEVPRVKPTVVVEVGQNDEIVQREVFGPVSSTTTSADQRDAARRLQAVGLRQGPVGVLARGLHADQARHGEDRPTLSTNPYARTIPDGAGPSRIPMTASAADRLGPKPVTAVRKARRSSA